MTIVGRIEFVFSPFLCVLSLQKRKGEVRLEQLLSLCISVAAPPHLPPPIETLSLYTWTKMMHFSHRCASAWPCWSVFFLVFCLHFDSSVLDLLFFF